MQKKNIFKNKKHLIKKFPLSQHLAACVKQTKRKLSITTTNLKKKS